MGYTTEYNSNDMNLNIDKNLCMNPNQMKKNRMPNPFSNVCLQGRELMEGVKKNSTFKGTCLISVGGAQYFGWRLFSEERGTLPNSTKCVFPYQLVHEPSRNRKKINSHH